MALLIFSQDSQFSYVKLGIANDSVNDKTMSAVSRFVSSNKDQLTDNIKIMLES